MRIWTARWTAVDNAVVRPFACRVTGDGDADGEPVRGRCRGSVVPWLAGGKRAARAVRAAEGLLQRGGTSLVGMGAESTLAGSPL